MKTLAALAAVVLVPSFAAAQQCYTGTCYRPVATVVKAAPPVYNTTHHTTNSYVYPPPVIFPIGIPVNYQVPLAKLNYTYSTAQGYQTLDPNLFVREASNYIQLANKTAGEGFANLAATVDQISEHDATVAKFAEMAKAFAVANNGSLTTTRTTTRVESAAPGVSTATVTGNFSTRNQLLAAKCVQCHAGYVNYDNLAGDVQLAIKKRIRSHNAAFRMPAGAGSVKGAMVPGMPLTDGEMELFDD